ncbi:hypothetical protein AgCh_001632 [Apium graveolens]
MDNSRQLLHPNQDPSSIYFVHPSDSNSSQLVSTKFNGNGFINWKRSMLLSLSAKNKLSFIDGTLPRPIDTTPEAKAWDRCNDLVCSWLLFNLNDNIAKSVLFLRTAREIWLDLEERFGYTSMPQLYYLEQQLSEMNQGSQSISEFFTSIKLFTQEEKHKKLSERVVSNESLAFATEKRQYDNAKYKGNSGFNQTNRQFPPKNNVVASANVKRTYYCSHCKIPDQYKQLLNLLNHHNMSSNSTDATGTTGHVLLAVPDGRKVKVTHICVISLSPDIILNNVLYVPEFQFNLISIQKLCQDLSCEILFTNDKCVLQFLSQNKREIHLGSIQAGLYSLDMHNVKSVQIASHLCNSACLSAIEDAKLWHLRLGHIPFQQLKFVIPSCNVKTCLQDTICQICPAAKQTRLPFTHSYIKTTSVFEMLHLDTLPY